jgi:hypothetical protein
MSEWDAIKAREAEGRLHAVRPRLAKDPIERAMFLATYLHEPLMEQRSDPQEIARYAALWVQLEAFVTGLPVTDAQLKRLTPFRDGVWEIRNKKPNPSLRVFGLFVSRDVFIGTNYQLRSALETRIDWQREIRRARHEWRELFDFDPAIGELYELASKVVYVSRKH